jgi:hypothetical protein
VKLPFQDKQPDYAGTGLKVLRQPFLRLLDDHQPNLEVVHLPPANFQ